MRGVRRSALVACLLVSAGCRVDRVEAPQTETHPGTETEAQPGAGRSPAAVDGAGVFTLEYGDRTVVVRADPGLAGEVQRLFALLEDLRAESVVISERTQLPIGWTTLSFRVDGAFGEQLTVLEPDYAGDPESEVRADVSVSLATLARQRAVLERVGVPGEAIDFDEHVTTFRGVLDVEEVLLLRVVSPGGRLTGWRLAPMAGIPDDGVPDSLPVHEVLRARPILVDAMLLPPGYMVYFAGDRMTAIVDPEDNVVWDGSGDPGLPAELPGELDLSDGLGPGSSGGPRTLLPPLGD